MTFEYVVADAILIAGQCIIFTGKVETGEVHVGDNLFLQSPQGRISVKVISLEPSGFRRAGARAGDNVAVVVEYLDLAPVADGCLLIPGNRVHVQSLILRGPQV